MIAIQDQLRNNHCYGCGAENPLGMRIKSYWHGDECVCRYMPKPEQCAGPKQYVYGGTIASLVDCHSNCTAMSNYYRLAGREIGSDPEIWCVTGRLTVNYRAPTPIDTEIEVRAVLADVGERKTVVKSRVYSGDTLTAEGEMIAVRVAESWKSVST